MSKWEALAWFGSIFGTILLIFERVEKYSSKRDLENYYLLLTVHPKRVNIPFHLALVSFLDKIFGSGFQLGFIRSPALSKVIIYSIFVNTILLLLVFSIILKQMNYTYFIGPTIKFMIYMSIPGILFDFLSFTKTRTLIWLISNRYSGFASYFAILFLDFLFLILLSFVYLLGLQFIPNDWAFTVFEWRYEREMFSSMAFLYLAISGSLSTLVFFIFLISAILSLIRNLIPSLQLFIDNHSSVQEKPLQILGLCAALSFGVVYWTIYAAVAFAHAYFL